MILTKALKSLARPVDMVTPSWTQPELVGSFGGVTASGQSVSPENSKTVAAAYRCGNILSDDVAKLPLQVFISRRSGEIERMRPNGLMPNVAWRTEVQPNRWWSPFLFKKTAIQWLLYWGNAYIWQPAGITKELFILPANTTYPVFDTSGNLWYAATFRDGTKDVIPAVEVLHLMINSTDGYLGKSVIAYARETIGRQLGAYETQNKFYAHGLNPAAIIYMPGDLDAEGRKKVRDKYEEAMGGSGNAARLAVMDSKVTKFEPITMKPVDVQFLESIQATDGEIANFFGMPLHKLNMGKQSYESNEQQQLDYLSTTLDPYLRQWEQAALIKWLPTSEQGYTYFRFERSALFSTNATSRGEYLNGAVNNGRLTPNEARQIEDRPAFPGGDQLYLSANVQPIGTTGGQNAANQ